ncbi:MAG TPA: lipoyl synthase [Kiritimatiellia bacterium]|jgi:lipoic acid synthetase
MPTWIRLKWKADSEFASVQNLLGDMGLHTVCKSAKCPNIHECWGQGTATLMLLGDTCTRACRFCAIKAGRPTGLDLDEPRRVAEAAKRMSLQHIVLTSVARDDLPDGGSGIFAETIRALRQALPESSIEVLTPDFQGDEKAMDTVLDAGPDVFNHNLETVARLQAVVRPQASYGRSLSVLRQAAGRANGPAVKSGIMLGLGETDDELVEAMRDLHGAGVRLLTLGQYLQPTKRHRDVHRFVMPQDFDKFAVIARDMGFKGVASGPMVRSSYKAHELLALARAS